MRETSDDLEALQQLLDRSWEAGGPHLQSIITPERRVPAGELAEMLQGMQLLVLATVTADGRPLTGPVDGIFYRGEFWFGSGVDSLRHRHIRARPHVSVTHHRGEPFAVTVHGRAEVVDYTRPEYDGFREVCVEIYGPEWNQWREDDGAFYARIVADRMFTARFEGPEFETG